jgi:GT2 family glycosyltransferase
LFAEPFSVAIVIPSHNRADLLRACVRTVTDHAPPDAEIIIVDDASPAGSASAVAETFAKVRVVRLPRRRGFCVAVNAGVQSTSADVVQVLNDDTEVTAGWVDAALEHFQNPDVAAVAPVVLRTPEYRRAGCAPIIDSAGDRYYVGGIAGKRGHGQPLGPKYLTTCRVFGASGSSAFYRRAALLGVGGFPERFEAYFDDVDVAFRLRRAGYHAVFEPRCRIYHHVSSSYGHRNRKLLERQSCNEERVFWRNLPGPVVREALLRHLAVLLGKAQRRWREGTLIPFLCGRFRALGELRESRQHCRSVGQRTASANPADWDVELQYWDQT